VPCARFQAMKPSHAILELRTLQLESEKPELRRSGPEHELWKASVITVMSRSLGNESEILFKFRSMRYLPSSYYLTPEGEAGAAKYFSDRVRDAVALIEAAIFELNLGSEENVDSTNYDDELWQHIQHSVEEERWEQVASAAVIFVEHKVRRWAGGSLSDKNEKLVGKALFAKAFGEGGPLALGSQPNETQGWQSLGMGFAAALGNVDRHNIQDHRPDLKQYSLGVLGLASLLLTQIRYTHPDAVS